jgi:hypothetical protein
MALAISSNKRHTHTHTHTSSDETTAATRALSARLMLTTRHGAQVRQPTVGSIEYIPPTYMTKILVKTVSNHDTPRPPTYFNSFRAASLSRFFCQLVANDDKLDTVSHELLPAYQCLHL